MCINFNGYHSGGSTFVNINDCWLLQTLFVYHIYKFSLEKEKKKIRSPSIWFHTPKTVRIRQSGRTGIGGVTRTQTAFAMAQPEFSRSMAEMDYSQVGLPQFFYPNEISQPPHERMTKLEAALVEMKRVHAECATSQVQFMELTRANVQI